jgi:hypothetical protein
MIELGRWTIASRLHMERTHGRACVPQLCTLFIGSAGRRPAGTQRSVIRLAVHGCLCLAWPHLDVLCLLPGMDHVLYPSKSTTVHTCVHAWMCRCLLRCECAYYTCSYRSHIHLYPYKMRSWSNFLEQLLSPWLSCEHGYSVHHLDEMVVGSEVDDILLFFHLFLPWTFLIVVILMCSLSDGCNYKQATREDVLVLKKSLHPHPLQ